MAAKSQARAGAALASGKRVSTVARVAVALLISALAACGGKSVGPNPEGGSGATSNGGTGTGGTATGGAAAGGGSQAGTASAGAASACSARDDDAGALVQVAILNKTTAPLYIGQQMVTCGLAPLFQVADARGGVLSPLGSCRTACSTLRKQGAAGCPAICLFPTSVALQPGEIDQTTWDGLYQVPATLPAACVPFDAGEDTVSCDQAKRIQPGSFKFSAQAGTALDCSQTTGADNCSQCMSNANGGCSTPGSLIGGKILTAETTVALDASYGVYATPSAGPSPGAGDTAPVGGLTVQLVFTDQ